VAWTAPRTWVAGEVVTAAELNTHVRDNLTFLHDNGFRNYARVQGTVNWANGDDNHRAYAPFTSTVVEFDELGYFSLSGGQLHVLAGNYIVGMGYIHGAVVALDCAFYPIYNGTTVDVGGMIHRQAVVGSALAPSGTSFFITNFFAGAAGTIEFGGWNTAGGSGTAILTVVRIP